MILPDRKIVKLIKRHHVLTLATASASGPYCANCFYIYLEDRNLFAFTSGKETRHIRDIAEQSEIAGTIFLETGIIGKIQGIQFTGTISEPDGKLLSEVKSRYLLRFPVALLMDTCFWVVEPDFIKMTDNRFGIGNKLIWERGR